MNNKQNIGVLFKPFYLIQWVFFFYQGHINYTADHKIGSYNQINLIISLIQPILQNLLQSSLNYKLIPHVYNLKQRIGLISYHH